MPHLLNLSPSLTRTINLEMMHMAVHHFRRRISKIRQTSCPSRFALPYGFDQGGSILCPCSLSMRTFLANTKCQPQEPDIEFVFDGRQGIPVVDDPNFLTILAAFRPPAPTSQHTPIHRSPISARCGGFCSRFLTTMSIRNRGRFLEYTWELKKSHLVNRQNGFLSIARRDNEH